MVGKVKMSLCDLTVEEARIQINKFLDSYNIKDNVNLNVNSNYIKFFTFIKNTKDITITEYFNMSTRESRDLALDLPNDMKIISSYIRKQFNNLINYVLYTRFARYYKKYNIKLGFSSPIRNKILRLKFALNIKFKTKYKLILLLNKHYKYYSYIYQKLYKYFIKHHDSQDKINDKKIRKYLRKLNHKIIKKYY